ncbi:hypothetical protein D6C84_02119 [Aureobasidium pullulans]|uniref:Chromo domain-containing protein n=1 Tax=Aureobasidium pullulans TaxID=5580 RepID=A0A4S9Y6W4_AURPU|nr:hypothetical protein D6C84_02119 [Aureobasidium pullulans]
MTTTTEPGSVSATAKASHFSSRLDTKPSDSAAKIVSRSSPSRGLVTYTLQIGPVPVPDVSASEVTDYVSAHGLEVFENQAFEREAAEEEARQKARLADKARTRRLKGATHSDSGSDSSSGRDESVGVSILGGESARATARGRQRPTYTHFYPKQRAPRGSSKPTVPNKSISLQDNGSHNRDNKRRRLEEHRDGSVSSAQDVESIYSIASPEQPTQPPSAMEQAAGMITDTQEESDPMDPDDESDDDIEMPVRQPTRSGLAAADETVKGDGKAAASSFFTFRDRALPSASRVTVSDPSQPASTKAKTSSTPEVRVTAPLAKARASTSVSTPASASTVMTSRQPSAPDQRPITTGSNGTTSSREAVMNLDDSASDSEDSEIYSVERILAHNLSDPKSHDRDIHGDKPVMLYQVKWEGYDETTWEPATSFEDKDVLQEYWTQYKQKQKQKQLASS